MSAATSGAQTTPASPGPKTPPAPSGAQFRIALGDQRATITEVGANLREYAVGDRDVITSFGEHELAPASNGGVLIPWPNRLADGQYAFDGVEYQLPITEPDRATALHGLGSWERWTVVAHDAASVALELALVPVPGYPFAVRVRVTYTLSQSGLHIRVAATNEGAQAAPYGVGFHPWLSPGGAALDECTLRLDATSRVTTDARLLPTGTEPAAGGFDFRAPQSLRGIALDDAYVDVIRDGDGLSWLLLAAPDGRTAAVWMDATMDTWQVCTGDALSNVAVRRTGLAAEPMSCIADAFRTGDRLIRLEPGASHEVTWGIALL
ncbi:aldose 1-epimerase family protein [Pengzhenrongella sicca]|uniref:Aldose 1-epimerase family protein n=1 Tax=Pengzhenrongella sicca TaxID=2819238 RepID=A0A8A4ZP25_9MICO|nr:aldose 1-epimerase family protein [Pengzhenrongella sicca]